MKTGILTFPNSPSFGASLQMRGLYRALQDLGSEVEIINYQNTYMADKNHISKRNAIRNVLISLLDAPGKKSFREFEKQLAFFPKRPVCENNDLSHIANRYDRLICGSDQVWNPKITGEDLNYFFSFCDDDYKKVSYAASFGVNELPASFAQGVKEQLGRFSHISVREEQGARIVGDLMNLDCSVVLDPTMLIQQDEWRACEKKLKGLPDKYIARFIFNHDENVETKIRELSQKTGLPVVTVGGTLLSKMKSGLYTGPIGPAQWLYVLDHADYVVTDSFHGGAFSIIFHKKLFVSLASSTNSRLKNLLRTFGMEDRVIGESMIDRETDYDNVQRIMDIKREESIGFLKKALGIGG